MEGLEESVPVPSSQNAAAHEIVRSAVCVDADAPGAEGQQGVPGAALKHHEDATIYSLSLIDGRGNDRLSLALMSNYILGNPHRR